MTEYMDKIPVFLITSSNRKHEHLSFLSKKTGLRRNYRVEIYRLPWDYEEVQSDQMEHLLAEAMERDRFNEIRDTFFIIEQTSVFLDDQDGQSPGQYFKKWWQSQSREDLKEIIRRDPGATIESGIAMNVPGHDPLVFTNTQQGEMTLDGGIRKENQQYAWLNKKDFNYYFRPEGANKVYNEMDLREFRKYDFRRPQFEKISERLSEYFSILQTGTTISSLNNVADRLRPQLEDITDDNSTTSSAQSKLHDDYGQSKQ